MSTLKVDGIRSNSASSDAITLAGDGTCTANITNNLSNRNLIINGAMQVAQRGTSSTSAGYETVDRFTTSMAGTDEACTFAQVDVTADTDPWNLGFRKAFKVTNGNQTSGAGASDDLSVRHNIEAQNISNSGWDYTSSSSFITLSFWVKSSVAQTFYTGFRIYGSDQREYCFSYALSADTWTKVTKSIPGADGNSILNSNALGAFIQWPLWWGTDFTSSGRAVDTWQVKNNASNYPDNTSTWYTTNDATFEITGVQLEVGSVATDFEHRSFGQELALCQRYFQKYSHGTYRGIGGFHGRKSGSGTVVGVTYGFPPMRAAATGSVNNAAAYRTFRYTDAGTSTPSAAVVTHEGSAEPYTVLKWTITTSDYSTGQFVGMFTTTNSGELELDAEL